MTLPWTWGSTHVKPDPRLSHYEYVYWGWASSAVIEVLLAIVPNMFFLLYYYITFTKLLASNTMYIGISHTRARVNGMVAGHFVPCPLRNLPLRTTKNNRLTSSYHLYLPVRTTSTYHFVPTTSYLSLRTTF